MNINFNEILSPITSTGRQRLQENFDMIKSHLDDLNNRLSVISPDNVEDLLQEIQEALSGTADVISRANQVISESQAATQFAQQSGQQAISDGQTAIANSEAAAQRVLADGQTAIANSEAAAQRVLADGQTAINNSEQAAQEVLALGQQALELGQQAQALGEQARLKGNETEAIGQQVEELLPLIERFTNEQTNLQNQINQLVANGDSSPEAAQARVGVDSFTSPTLKVRIDREINALSKSTQNLLINTNQDDSFVIGTASSGGTIFTVLKEDSGEFYYRLESNADSITRLVSEQNNRSRYRTFENGKQYTISYLARSNRSDINANYNYILNVPTPNFNVSPNTPLNNQWTLHFRTFTWNLGNVSSKINIGMERANDLMRGDYFEFKRVMINEGTLPLPYYPNELDFKKIMEENYLFKQSSISDFNQLTKQGTYFMNGTNGLLNAPNSNHSYYLTVLNRPGLDFAIQLAKRIGTNEYYTRSQVSPSSNNFTDWQNITLNKSTTAQAQAGTDDVAYMTPLKVREAINYYGLTQRGSLPTGTDLNGIVESGIYNLNTSNYINRPDGSAQGVLLVIEGILGATGNSVQLVIGGNVVSSTYHFRTRNGPLGQWSDWERINLNKSTTAQAQAGTDDTTYMTPLKSYQSIYNNGLTSENFLIGSERIVSVKGDTSLVDNQGIATINTFTNNASPYWFSFNNYLVDNRNSEDSYNYIRRFINFGENIVMSLDYEVVYGSLAYPNIYFHPQMGYLKTTSDEPLAIGKKVKIYVSRPFIEKTSGMAQIHIELPQGNYRLSNFKIEKGYKPTDWNMSSGDIELNKTRIGNLSTLQTTNKTNLVSAINEVFQEVDNGKNLVASAITDKGVATPGTATFQQMANNIELINAGVPYASGIKTSSSASLNFSYYGDSTSGIPRPYVEVSGLTFRPRKITLNYPVPGSDVNYFTEYDQSIGNLSESVRMSSFDDNTSGATNYHIKGNVGNCYVNDTGFRLPVFGNVPEKDFYWEAWG